MICTKCGKKLTRLGVFQNKIYYRCPGCGEIEAMDKKAAESKTGGGSNAEHYLGAAAAVVGVFAAGFGISTAGDRGLLILSMGVLLLAAAGIMFAAGGRNGKLGAIFGAALTLYGVAAGGAFFGFPEIIRSIPGKEFVDRWGVFSFAVSGIAFGIYMIICLVAAADGRDRAKTACCCDGDLMIVQGFSRYMQAGYYLIKARLHGIVRFRTTEATEDTASKNIVELNGNIPKEKLEEYFQRNPQVRRLVRFLEERMYDPNVPTQISDVINGFAPQSELRSEGGLIVLSVKNTLSRVRNVIFGMAAAAVLYVGVTKLCMGMHFGKPIGDLLESGILVAGFTLGALYGLMYLCAHRAESSVKKKLVKAYKVEIPDFEQYTHSVVMGQTVTTDAERQRILRCFATYRHNNAKHIKNGAANIPVIILHAVSVAEIIESERRLGVRGGGGCSGYSCSSCSSCSSCGGCGGCGGCGD